MGSFATCLCADISGGVVTLANAGHLSPYRGGQEVSVQPGLPLGIVVSPEAYEERSFNLEPGDTLTFLSDGVVEARNSRGALFGFERAEPGPPWTAMDRHGTAQAPRYARINQRSGRQEGSLTANALCDGSPQPSGGRDIPVTMPTLRYR